MAEANVNVLPTDLEGYETPELSPPLLSPELLQDNHARQFLENLNNGILAKTEDTFTLLYWLKNYCTRDAWPNGELRYLKPEVISKLVELLGSCRPEVVLVTLAIIQNFAKTSKAALGILITANVRAVLIDLFDHSVPEVQGRALITLAYVYQGCHCGMGKLNFQPEDIRPMLRFTKRGLGLQLVRCVCEAYFQICKIIKSDWIYNMGYDLHKLHSFLASQLYTADADTILYVVSAMALLSQHKEELSWFIQFGVCRELISLLKMSQPPIQEQILNCLHHLANGTVETRQVIINSGSLPVLVQLAHGGTTDMLAINACWVLANVACGRVAGQVAALVRAGSAPVLLDFLKQDRASRSQNPELSRATVTRAVCAIAMITENDVRRDLIMRGCILCMCRELDRSRHDAARADVAECLEALIVACSNYLEHQSLEDQREFLKQIMFARRMLRHHVVEQA